MAVGAHWLITTVLAKHQPQIGPRIVNGNTAVSGQFPFYVFFISILQHTDRFCAGSLISSGATHWILTAAHCLDENAIAIQVHLGALSVNEMEIGRRIIKISPQAAVKDHLYVHPKFDYTSKVK